MTPTQRYLQTGNSIVGFTGKDVLEVGGCVNAKNVLPYAPASWISIDINPRRLNDELPTEINFDYREELMSVTNMSFAADSFDRVFSINCFEHIDDMEKALAEIHRVLRPGGLLFSLFGPIWSGPVGHHTWVEIEDRLYHFNENVFPDWWHLTKSPSEFASELIELYGDVVAQKIVDYVHNSNDLNRLCDGDYQDLIMNSQLHKILLLRNRSRREISGPEKSAALSRWPNARDFRTNEFLVVLSKTRIGPIGTTRILFGLFIEGIGRLMRRINT